MHSSLPAISVLSAVEGLSVAAPSLERLILPITIGVITGLFFIQRHGTGSVGKLFGPVTLVWFAALAVLGALSIAETPSVLRAMNPMYAIDFAIEHPAGMFLLLSAVFLALTGGEALYADMGHFGAKPVRLAWYGLVCPALLINYFGQGALVLRSAEAIQNPFYLLSPDWFMLPLGRAGDCRHGDRFAGHYFRRLFDDAASHAHGLPAAPVHPAHLGFAARADLHPGRELDDAGRRDHSRTRIWLLWCAGCGLRHRRLRHHDHHHVAAPSSSR